MPRITRTIILLTGLIPGLMAADPADLGAKEVFTRGFPQGLAFRGELSRPMHKDYAAWTAAVQDQAGMIRKFIPEELPHLHQDATAWSARFLQEHPEKLQLLHLNGEARQVIHEAAVHARYFPGHWIHHPGSLLTADAAPEATELQVENVAPFKVDAYLDRGDNEDGKRWFPQMLTLVPVDGQGNRDWYGSEYAIVTGVDKARKTVSVKRGQVFSTARAHAARRTQVVPLAAGVWGGAPMWFYNLSSACPRDRQGRTAGEAFVDEIAGWLGPQGPLAHFHGIAFDVNYWYAREPGWDVDNDGRGDGGMVGGVNAWRLGDWRFLSGLRTALGDRRLITADGQHFNNQQAVGILDGIESEGLVQHNDGFRGLSRTINTHLYWSENTPRAHDLRYVVLKLKNPLDEQRREPLQRLAVGTACCLGALTTSIPVGLLPAAFAQPGSLGRPEGALLRPARQTPDLFRGAGLAATLVAQGCALTRRDGHIDIAPTEAGTGSMTVTIKDCAVPAGDLTLVVDMQALEPLEGFPADSFVPRKVEAVFSQVPAYGEKRYDGFHSALYGWVGTHKRSVMAFHLRRPRQPAQTMDISLVIEGRGRVALHGLSAHGAADTLVRAFTHGVVVVNPALEPLAIPLQGVPGAGTTLPATVTVPALDAVFLPRP